MTRVRKMMWRRVGAAAVALMGALQGAVGHAHEAPPAAAAATPVAPPQPWMQGALPTVAARYELQVLPARHSARAARTLVWYFFREAQRVAVVKGDIEETWFRDQRDRVRFERTFHDEQRVVEYSTGELAALGVATDWQSISTFLDIRGLSSLKPLGVRGGGTRGSAVLAGRVGSDTLRVRWLADLQLPAWAERREADGTRVRLVLKQSAAAGPGDWPRPGIGGADYLRIDAADFGDMAHDPLVRKAEAMDVGVGWRASHHHR